MPAIDINPDISSWMRELLGQLQANRQRQLVAVQGSRQWCDRNFQSLLALRLSMQVFSNRELGGKAIPFNKADTCLGSEAELVVIDMFGGFNPDLVCIAAGLVPAGGVLVLLSPPLSDWDLQADAGASWQDQSRSREARFVERFFGELANEQRAGYILTRRCLPALESTLPPLQPTAIEDGETPQQQACLRQIAQWLASARTGIALLRARRGRGKSSCLGLLARRLADRRVLVCANSRQAAAELLRFAPGVEFVAPDRLLREAPPAELVIVDEAAMIPLSLLRQLARRYTRLVMATTSDGYEGTGQGFMLRFVAALDAQQLLQLELQDPVRWCRDDFLEGWLDRVLLQDRLPQARDETIDVDACRLEVIDDPGAADCFPVLAQAYRLLNQAHYRTRPSDLRMLMENPDLRLIVARHAGRVVGALLLNREGGFDADLAQQVYLGNRRPRGHLLAQMLTAQAGIEGFAVHRGLRVQRVAVAERWRRRGIGTRLLDRAREYARDSADYLGASFALDGQSADFWKKAGFDLVHVSFAQGKSSGDHSVAVLDPLCGPVDEALRQLQQRLNRQLPVWLTQFLQFMEAGQVVALLRFAGFATDVSDLERRDIEAFASGNRGFDLCFASLQRFVMQRIAESGAETDALLVEKAVQNRPWACLPRADANEGRKQLQKRLRGLVEALLKDC